MKTLTSWLLGGALAASLAWNWNLTRASRAQGDSASCAGPASCGLDTPALGLDGAQRAALEELCRTSCSASEELEGRAQALQRELIAALADTHLDAAAAHARVEEIAALRGRALGACVDGILGVRAVLSPAQLGALLAACGPGSTSCR